MHTETGQDTTDALACHLSPQQLTHCLVCSPDLVLRLLLLLLLLLLLRLLSLPLLLLPVSLSPCHLLHLLLDVSFVLEINEGGDISRLPKTWKREARPPLPLEVDSNPSFCLVARSARNCVCRRNEGREEGSSDRTSSTEQRRRRRHQGRSLRRRATITLPGFLSYSQLHKTCLPLRYDCTKRESRVEVREDAFEQRIAASACCCGSRALALS